MLTTVEHSWQRYLSWGRVALTVAAFAISYLFPPPAAPVIHILAGLFAAYALVLALRVTSLAGMLGLLALFGDTVFFLILASFGNQPILYLAAVFYLYLLTEALVYYTAIELVMISTVSAIFCGVLPYAPIRSLEPTVLVASTLACGFAVVQQRQKRRFEALTQKLAEAEKTAEKSREAESQRIASDFHDGPLQSFISLQMRLEILRKLLDRDFHAGLEDLKQLQSLAQTQVRDLRAFLHSMRPVDVDGANLVATARRTAETFQKETGIPVTFLGTNIPVGLPQEMSLEVLQMLRESLHNVQKHAGATRVAVSMEKTDRGLEISVDDNGHGFNFAGTYNLEELELLRLGPASLKRRARSLNADLQLDSRPGRGAGLKFRVPLQ